jgi:hypothetical protein
MKTSINDAGSERSATRRGKLTQKKEVEKLFSIIRGRKTDRRTEFTMVVIRNELLN